MSKDKDKDSIVEAIEAKALKESSSPSDYEWLKTYYSWGYSLAAPELEDAKKEISELKAWKESAISVMPDMQAIGKALGVKLGDSIHDKILPGIERLKNSPAARYGEALQRLYPFCHEDGMKGESDWEKAWLNAEAALLSVEGNKPLDDKEGEQEDYWKQRCEASEKMYIWQLRDPDSEEFHKAFDQWQSLFKQSTTKPLK